MQFISNGDFLLPLHFKAYWTQHLYTWSFERGAANPDGIMRLPGRLIDLLAFALAGNVAFGYFYLATCLLIAFGGFWWFARAFLGARRWSVAALGALFFACNPIFLGNLSKVGLILAVAMLPIMLTSLKLGFEQRRFSYFLLFLLALNISLLHPFTFAVNLLVGGAYGVWMARKRMPFVRDNMWKFALLGVVGLLLNAYFLLPLASLNTLNKDALSSTVSSTPTDYTSLVDVANTGDIFTGLSLSKGVLKDYEFYGPLTWPFYFLGVFLFYALLFGAYIKVEKRAKPRERQRFVLALGVFLGLLVLATASYLYADVLIKFMIGLPGGWMFRSPLKWQLYMPLALFAALVIALKYVRKGRGLVVLYAAFGLSFLLMNGYLGKQIYDRLLTPRTVTHFSALLGPDMDNKSLLFADSSACTTYAENNPAVATELNEVLVSKPLQVKHIQNGELDSVNLSQYDFVMGCAGALDAGLLSEQYAFRPARSFVGDIYQLYKNTRPAPYVGAAAQVFTLDEPAKLGGKYALARMLGQPFHFVTGSEGQLPAVGLQDLFETLTPGSFAEGTIRATAGNTLLGRQQLFIKDGQKVYIAHPSSHLQLSAAQEPGMEPAPPVVDLADQKLDITYHDPTFTYENLIANGSLEKGLWHEKVGDCNAYDNKPAVLMSLDRASKSDGRQSLELGARAHIACTSPADVRVEAGQHYLFSFDYQSEADRRAGYYAGFDNLAGTSSGARLASTEGKWAPFQIELIAPEGAEHLQLMLYAYPAGAPGATGRAHYDNLRLVRIPPITNRFFAVAQAAAAGPAPKVSFTKNDPTRTHIYIKNAAAPFYLTTKESYHRLWQLHLSRHAAGEHLRLDGTMNGWYIDPAKLCETGACGNAHDGGAYDFELTMAFAPQHWFYAGALISGVTAVLALNYVGWDWWRGGKR